MSLLDVFNEVNLNLPDTGDDIADPQPVSGIGDAAYFYWDADEPSGELQFVSGEKVT